MFKAQRVALALLLLPAFGTLGCTHYFYRPSSGTYSPAQAELGLRQVSFKSLDGTRLSGWYFPALRDTGISHQGTIIQFHGNSGNLSSNYRSLVWVTQRGFDFFTFDYRGYGLSEGKPSQEGVNQDAVAAVQYVLDQDKGSHERNIVLYGQSLGGAVMMRALQDVPDRSRIRAVVADSTFYSYRALGRSFVARSIVGWPFQPLASVLLSDEYSPEDSIARISPIPLLVIHGDADSVVPLKFGQKIYDLAQEPKKLWVIPEGRHIKSMEVDSGRYRDRLVAYLKEI